MRRTLEILALNYWHTDSSTKAGHAKPQKQLVAPRDASRFAYLVAPEKPQITSIHAG
jgi:hypothetical protein